MGQFMFNHCLVSNQLNRQALVILHMEKVIAAGCNSMVDVLKANRALVGDFERNLRKLFVFLISIEF